MLRIDTYQTIEGLTVYQDDAVPTTHYVLPEMPRFRRDDDGVPIFRFLKYKAPRPREDGKNGGGFVVFDAEFTVEDDKREAILDELKRQASKGSFPGEQDARERALQQMAASRPGARAEDIPPPPPPRRLRPEDVKLGQIQWAKGTATINLSNIGNTFVERVFNPAGPSLFGNNITPFTVELTQEGSTLLEAALQGQGGFVQVSYQMSAWVKLPPITGRAWFHAEQFYDYVQEASDDDDIYEDDTFINKITEDLIASQAMGVEFDSGMAEPKVADKIRESLYRTLEDTIAAKILEKVPTYTGDRSVPDDYEKVRREFHGSRIDDFTYTITEKSATLWPFNPQGTMPNITSLKNKSGQAILWKDHSTIVDLDDPFFRTITVQVHVNADFDDLDIHSVDVHLEYGGAQGGKLEVADYHFTKADDLGKFSVFRQGDLVDYTYSYRVNYKGASKAFVAPPQTERREQLTIGVDEAGLLLVDVEAGNLDFTKFPSTTIAVKYAPLQGAAIEERYVLKIGATTHRLSRAIFEARDRPVTYDVEYHLAEGRTIVSAGNTTRGNQIVVDSPFKDIRTFAFRAVGNLDTEIESIEVEATYADPATGYTVRDARALTKTTDFWDWPVPVLDATAGTLTYSATIRRKDGTVEIVPPAVATGSVIPVGEKLAKVVSVTVIADLVDFSQVKLVKVELRYRPDGATDDQLKDFVIRDGAALAPWVIEVSDPTKTSYTWSASYFLPDGRAIEIPEASTADPTVVLPALSALPGAPPPVAPPPVAPVAPAAPVVPAPVPAPAPQPPPAG